MAAHKNIQRVQLFNIDHAGRDEIPLATFSNYSKVEIVYPEGFRWN